MFTIAKKFLCPCQRVCLTQGWARAFELGLERGVLERIFRVRVWRCQEDILRFRQYPERTGPTPAAECLATNPIFLLLLGDLNAKLARKEPAAKNFCAAQKLAIRDAACRARVQKVARAALGAPATPAPQTR